MSEFQRNDPAPSRVFDPRSVANATDSRKHKVVVETITQEKKKLRSVLTFKAQAPLGYTFIPAGNPQLTNALKEAARQENEQIFAVSTTPHQNVHDLSQQVHRIGFHFPNRIIDLVCIKYGIKISSKGTLVDQYGSVPLRVSTTTSTRRRAPRDLEAGEDQITINTKAREAITDLFPNIPNEDLWKIIKTAFQKGQHKVGTANELPLVRRAQLAVVAHIRHVYTDYDKLLRRGGYHTARTRVEKPTLEKLVAWRGDDENGSKMMEDVLKEVVVISDDESSEDERDNVATRRGKRDSSVETVSSDDDLRVLQVKPVNAGQIHTLDDSDRSISDDQAIPGTRVKPIPKARAESRKERDQRRGFDRYRHMAWDTAREHYRADPTQYTRSIAPTTHFPGGQTSSPHYPGPRTPYAEASSAAQLVPVSKRANVEASQIVLPIDNRNHRPEIIPRKVPHDHPETVRLADGFLYERIPHPVLVRSGRSVTPDSPASPIHRRQPIPGSSLPRQGPSGNALASQSTSRLIEGTRHDPETVIPSIERDQSPNSPSRATSKLFQTHESIPRAVPGHRSQVPVSYQPVEHLSNRVEIVRLDGAKRRLDDAFPAAESQDEPRKLYRPDRSFRASIGSTLDEADTNRISSYMRPVEGRSAVTAGTVKFQGSPKTPRVIREAVPFIDPMGAYVRSTEPHSHRADLLDLPHDRTRPYPEESSQISRSFTEGSAKIDRPNDSTVRPPRLVPDSSRTVPLSQPDFPAQPRSVRSFSRYEAVLSSPSLADINPPSQQPPQRDRMYMPLSHQTAHYDHVAHPQGQHAEQQKVPDVRDWHHPSRTSIGNLPVGSRNGQSDAVFLRTVSDNDKSPARASRTASLAVSSMPSESRIQQLDRCAGFPKSQESTRRIENTLAAEEKPPRGYLVIQSQDLSQKRYIDPAVGPRTLLPESPRSRPYLHTSRMPHSMDDSRVVRG